MKTHPLDRLLKSAATAHRPAATDDALDPMLEHRVLAAVRRARSEAEGIDLLAVLRWGVAFAGCAALCAILLSMSNPASSSVDEAFAVPEPETYLALQ
ncbi:MAG: hypothetical protein RIS24_2348 [Verrucomicrobiota bacterium]|jgi:hypothetical protein